MGITALVIVALCYVVVTVDLCRRRDWSGALMTLGSVVFTVGALWKLYER